MSMRTALVCLLLVLAAGAANGASLEQARAHYVGGDLDAARTEIEALMEEIGDDESRRPGLLKLLGHVEVDARNWRAALAAWGELTDRYALSAESTAISPAIRPLQALVDCGCAPPSPVAGPGPGDEVRPIPPGTPPPAPDPSPSPAAPPAPAPSEPVERTPGLFLIGGWGSQYDAAQEVTRDVIEFLEANGVAVRAGETEIPAIRGEGVVLSYLVEEARRVGAEGVILLSCRFSHRDFIEISRYDLNGQLVWTDKVTGGTGLKARHERDKPNWPLAERAKEKLADRIGTPDLPTQ